MAKHLHSRALTVRWLFLLLLAAGTAVAEPIRWVFPRDTSCHEGLPFADGITGVLVWGGGDTLKLTVGRADLWDHRGGYAWTSAQSYTNIVAACQRGDEAALKVLFAKETPPGEPRNPYMLPLGRVVVRMPQAELLTGVLDPFTGIGRIDFRCDGKVQSLDLAMSKAHHAFVLRLPESVVYEVSNIPAYDQPIAHAKLTAVGFKPPVRRADGFTQELPADPSVTLRHVRNGAELMVTTVRGNVPSPVPVRFDSVQAASRQQWQTFWREGARIHLPDAALQRMYDYGMYRFGAMTDPEGVPAGLQGAWLEDDRLVPWNGDYHFNINVQECYSPAYRGGHFRNLLPVLRMVLSWRDRLRDNARKFCGIDNGYVMPHSVDDRGVCIGGFWTGTIDHASAAWVAAMMMRYVRYSRDVAFLREGAFDFMKGAMNVYRAMMEERDGRLSIPLAPSPEWGSSDMRKAVGRDSSFQLAAAHRLARDLTDAAKLLGESPDPMWLDVEKRLPSYALDAATGISLFENRPFDASHRHHSHLAGFYPFDTIDFVAASRKGLVDKTYENWVSRGTGAWTGWCVPWAAILNVHFGSPHAAVQRLHDWETYYCDEGHGSHHDAWNAGFSALRWNRLVMQMDGQMAATTAILELLAHEWNGNVAFFRGCPESWREVSFENLALSDGARVNGRRINGRVTIIPVVQGP